MCGIAGIAGLHGLEAPEALVKRMTDREAHRGPDAEGIWKNDDVVLGHRRLSIIDLSAASNQPLHSADGKCTIIFNGELYNYKELKAHLVELALRRSAQKLEREFWNLPFEPYAPVRRQVVTIWKLVNEKRKVAGLPPLSQDCLRLRRKICRAFESVQEPEAA